MDVQKKGFIFFDMDETLGFFREEKEELFYVYRMEYTLHGRKYQQTGLICLLELDKQSILGHENTIDDIA